MRTWFLLATLAAIAVPSTTQAQADTAYIRTELTAIADAWNRADLDRHVAPYAD